MDITSLGLKALAEKIRNREIAPAEAVNASLARIRECEELNAFVTVCENQAAAAAEESAKRIAEGNAGALEGVPVAVKDNICTRGIRTTCASRMLENFIPPYDAEVVKRLKAAGAVIVGKTNMDEFAMGSGSENSYFGGVKNPADTSRVPGGSSGGSAACVAAGCVPCALGSDTGGSIRQPASFCGAVGFKPTYSAVSRYGLVAFASSLDQIGPITRSVEDAAYMMSVIAGHDEKDSTSFAGAYPDFSSDAADFKHLKVGIMKEAFTPALNPSVGEAVLAAAALAGDEGAELKEVSIGSFEAALATYYVLSSAEAASNLARYDGVKYGFRALGAEDYTDLYYRTRTEGFGDEVKRRIMIGNYVLSSGYYDAYYLKALKIRTMIKADFDRAFGECDVLLAPTAPSVAYPAGRKTADHAEIYLSDVCTVPVNIAGLPAISIPAGADENGLPIGLQLIGKAHSDARLLQIAAAFERALKG